MSNMKDYMMWLDDKGIATLDSSLGELIVPEGTDTMEYVEDYRTDAKWHDRPEDDELDDIEEEEELIIDDGDFDPDEVAISPNEQWFNPDGGLTGDAFEFLASVDAQGDFV
jgi:hypothetical protein